MVFALKNRDFPMATCEGNRRVKVKVERPTSIKKPLEGLSTTVPSLKLTAKAPENGWLEYYCPIDEAYFQGLC